MEKIIYTLALVLVLQCTLTIGNCMSQWQADTRLTNNTSSSQTSLSNAWSIASSGNILHVVWEDNRDGNTEIYYKRSTDGGTNWGTDTRLTNDGGTSNQASIAVSGSVVHVVWSDFRTGQGAYEIYYKRSTDAGLTWGADTRLSSLDFFSSTIPSLGVSGSIVSVVWEDRRLGYGIFFKGSSDGGISWGADKRLSDSVVYASNRGEVSVAVTGLLVHVVWTDKRTDPNGEIYYKRSTDGGNSWGADSRLTNNPSYSFAPSISVSGSNVHIVWTDNRDGYNQIFYKRSTDTGINWGADTRLTYDSATFYHANLATSGSNLHIVWRNVTAGFTALYYKRSTDAGLSWDSDLRFVNNSSHSTSQSVAVSGSTVNVVWSDDRDGNYEIYYKRNPTGNPVGIIYISSGIPSTFSLSQNYPNPFNPSTNIKFNVSKLSNVKIVVYDVMGREVQTLVNEKLQPGTYESSFDGSTLTSGVYFYKLSTEGFSETKKMMILK